MKQMKAELPEIDIFILLLVIHTQDDFGNKIIIITFKRYRTGKTQQIRNGHFAESICSHLDCETYTVVYRVQSMSHIEGDIDKVSSALLKIESIDIMNTASGKHKRAFAKLVFMGSNVNVMK